MSNPAPVVNAPDWQPRGDLSFRPWPKGLPYSTAYSVAGSSSPLASLVSGRELGYAAHVTALQWMTLSLCLPWWILVIRCKATSRYLVNVMFPAFLLLPPSTSRWAG